MYYFSRINRQSLRNGRFAALAGNVISRISIERLRSRRGRIALTRRISRYDLKLNLLRREFRRRELINRASRAYLSLDAARGIPRDNRDSNGRGKGGSLKENRIRDVIARPQQL